MQIQNIIGEIRQTLVYVFDEIDTWFEKPEEVRMYQPQTGGWTIDQILEHISLTSHFLLILIDKGARKALDNRHKANLEAELAKYIFERDKLDEIGIHQSFEWIRPEHMEPAGQKTPAEIRYLIREQRQRCLNHLDQVPDGEGILYKTTMTVNNPGKIDVYEYIYFLAKHAERHITQMQRNEREYLTTHIH